MADKDRVPSEQWTVKQAVLLGAICLVAGIVGGWSIRTLRSPAAAEPSKVGIEPAPAGMGAGPADETPSPVKMKEMADAKAAPLLERLKPDANNPDLLTGIGNIYYDAQQYSAAIDYYGRALKIKPSDAAVRTDMATAYWYMGNADTAIAEFNQALGYAPTSPNTLFNLGLVKWKGKQDIAGAVSDWQKLLAANPNYEARDKVEQMMAEAKKQAAGKAEGAGK
jgi:cytochrome c-type biogenesis protein CcmH/NrfG